MFVTYNLTTDSNLLKRKNVKTATPKHFQFYQMFYYFTLWLASYKITFRIELQKSFDEYFSNEIRINLISRLIKLTLEVDM